MNDRSASRWNAARVSERVPIIHLRGSGVRGSAPMDPPDKVCNGVMLSSSGRERIHRVVRFA